jgi:hypothetical protein
MEDIVQRQTSRKRNKMEVVLKGSGRNNENREKQMHT